MIWQRPGVTPPLPAPSSELSSSSVETSEKENQAVNQTLAGSAPSQPPQQQQAVHQLLQEVVEQQRELVLSVEVKLDKSNIFEEGGKAEISKDPPPPAPTGPQGVVDESTAQKTLEDLQLQESVSLTDVSLDLIEVGPLVC